MNTASNYAPTKLDQALALAARGFYVFPLVQESKLPLIDAWQHRATRDPDKIRKWWVDPVMGFEQDFNIGIATAQYLESGALLVIDVDNKGKKKGDATLAALETKHGSLPATYTQRTPTGGRHLVYRVASAVRQGVDVLGDGLDVRSRGGFIVGSGSIISDTCYTDNGAPIAQAPAWLVALCGHAPDPRQRKAPAVANIDEHRAKARGIDYLQHHAPVAIEGSGGDHTTYAVAAKLKDFGLSESDCVAIMLDHWNERCQPPWSADELAKKVSNAYQYGREPVGVAAPETQFSPVSGEHGTVTATLRTDNPVLHELATEAERALVAAGAQIYVRGASLVRPVVENVKASHGRNTKIARLAELTADSLVDHMSRAIRWTRFDQRKKAVVPSKPPRDVASTILSRDGEWTFPRLAGVITTPTLRLDGSLLDKAGYDESTRLLLIDPPALNTIPARPTRSDASAALELLRGLIAECPFVDDASQSVALSALVTPVVRGALPVVPLHVSRAPTAGSSKSFLMDIAAVIATGQLCPVISAGSNEAETEKRLHAAVIAGQPIVSIDNVNGELGGDALCQLVERPIVDVRPLGRSELIRIESRATIFATGNNIAVVGDMVRRTLVCSLDANLERPELRQFQRDPIELVSADRGKYVAAALTIVRAYLAAGCPNEQPALASFNQWSRLVRSALVWLGCADPVLTMETARAEDPETDTLHKVVGAWLAAVGTNKPLTAGQLIAAATSPASCESAPSVSFENTSLSEALSDIAGDRGLVDSKKLGRWLTRYKGRVIAGVKIVNRHSGHDKQNKWELTPAAGIAGICGYPYNPSRGFSSAKNNITAEIIPADTRDTRKAENRIDGACGKSGADLDIFR